jgi:hypothetical protein
MNPHDTIDIPIFVALVIVCVFVFMLQILFLNHILYDTYTTFVVGVQFNKNKIKNFINIYDTPQLKCTRLGRYWLKLHDSIFSVKRISRHTLYIVHKLSKMSFYVTTAQKRNKKCIKLQENLDLSITKDLLFIVNVPGYYIISNRFVE